jgi:fermentation-respiration switch protein FrsA (DUF1100 family)
LDLHRGERPLATTVYYPKNAAGPFPVVVFGHGFGGTPTAYAALLKRWAAAGFVVAAPAFPHTAWGVAQPDLLDVVNQPADVGAVLSGLVALPSSDALRKILDPSRAAVAGHSAGAITALGVFTDDGPEKRDKRFSAGIVLAGNSIGVGTAFSGASAPLLFVHAADDPVVPFWTGLGAYDAVPWPRAMLKLTGQEHTAPYLSKSDKQYAVVASTTVDFLRWSLYDDGPARARLLTTPNLDSHL